VAIVGGGIAGLTTAYLLRQAGLQVAVLEKNTIASGTTGGTTGKVTTQHGLIYAELLERQGLKRTRVYADASQNAFKEMEAIIKKEKIGCDWRAEDNYVYTAKSGSRKNFEKEAEAAARVGLPATYETSLPLPFEVAAAVKFAGQAKFNAVKYVQGLAKHIDSHGNHVFEHSEATIHRGRRPYITTEAGTVHSRAIVLAAKIPPGPLSARVTYGVLEHPETSYIVAAPYPGDLRGMYISPDHNHYSLLPIESADGPLLLVGGENHTPGLGLPARRYRKLSEYGRRWFNAGPVKYRWKAMDYIGYDNLPLAGRLYPWSRDIYVVSGLKKWGLNLGMVCSMIVRDQILQQKNEASRLFRPWRPGAPASIPKTMIEYLGRN
jgi:glycine/D-amino acid oxidase-like deaminating enzyme